MSAAYFLERAINSGFIGNVKGQGFGGTPGRMDHGYGPLQLLAVPPID